MASIKNIIFDLGGVLLDIDFLKTKRAFEKLGIKNFDNFYTKESANPVFEALETGQISNEDFYTALQKYCNPGTDFSQLNKAWNEILVDFRKESIGVLPELSMRYNLYLLSNTNRIHHAEFSAMYTREFNNRVFDNNFTKAYYSHTLQMRKPYLQTYLHVLDDAGINAYETIFIDDSSANIEGAKEAGLQTRLLLINERIENIGL